MKRCNYQFCGLHDCLDCHPVDPRSQFVKPKLTGGSSDYYLVEVDHPTRGGMPYVAECNDLIEALDLSYAEGNCMKAIWRIAKHRMGKGKSGTTTLYDAEKNLFFAKRILNKETPNAE